MAKFKERIQARKLRKDGKSVKEIAQSLNVSKGTVSLWVRDIILSVKQLERIRKKMITGAERGRLISALKQKHKRLNHIKLAAKKGCLAIPSLTKKEILVTGTALYWAEGSKKSRELSFCNSDPELIKFMINWLHTIFNISIDRFICRVGINAIHKKREKIVKEYWSKTTKIPLSQFNKTSFKKVKNRKIYSNYSKHYGTLVIKIRKPGDLYYDIIGLIKGLSKAKFLG